VTVSGPILEQGRVLLAAYAFHSGGMVPPMVYLADLAVRRHGFSIEVGSLLWFLFGAAGTIGGLTVGHLVDRMGGRLVLKILLGCQACALLLCLQPTLIFLAASLAGFVAVGTTTVTLALVQDIAGPKATVLWIRCTAAFSITQALIGFMLASIFAMTGESHSVIFLIGMSFSLVALSIARHL
jgi:predicted MFS family arabinose efflux permease